MPAICPPSRPPVITTTRLPNPPVRPPACSSAGPAAHPPTRRLTCPSARMLSLCSSSNPFDPHVSAITYLRLQIYWNCVLPHGIMSGEDCCLGILSWSCCCPEEFVLNSSDRCKNEDVRRGSSAQRSSSVKTDRQSRALSKIRNRICLPFRLEKVET